MPKDAIVYLENRNSCFWKLERLMGMAWRRIGWGVNRVVNHASLRDCYTIIRLSSIENHCLRNATILPLKGSHLPPCRGKPA